MSESPLRLPLTMLFLAFAGALARWAVSPDTGRLVLFVGPLLLLPVAVAASVCLQQGNLGTRWGAGIGAALAAAYCNFVLLDPQYNEDANIGLGLYALGGFVIPLGGAGVLGGLVGYLARPRAAAPPPPWLSWQGWGWPLLLPALGGVLDLWAEWRLIRGVPNAELTALTLFLGSVPSTLLLLAASTLPLVTLHRLAAAQGKAQPYLNYWWLSAAALTLLVFLWQTWPKLRG